MATIDPGRARLGREHRLASDGDFRRVRSEGRSWPHPFVVLYVSANGGPRSRLGVVASKRLGTAVTRNRVKRRIREIVRRRLGRLRPGFDLVLVARGQGAQAAYADLDAAVATLLRRAGLQEG